MPKRYKDIVEEGNGNTHGEEDIDADKDCFCWLEWDLEIGRGKDEIR